VNPCTRRQHQPCQPYHRSQHAYSYTDFGVPKPSLHQVTSPIPPHLMARNTNCPHLPPHWPSCASQSPWRRPHIGATSPPERQWPPPHQTQPVSCPSTGICRPFRTAARAQTFVEGLCVSVCVLRVRRETVRGPAPDHAQQTGRTISSPGKWRRIHPVFTSACILFASRASRRGQSVQDRTITANARAGRFSTLRQMIPKRPWTSHVKWMPYMANLLHLQWGHWRLLKQQLNTRA